MKAIIHDELCATYFEGPDATTTDREDDLTFWAEIKATLKGFSVYNRIEYSAEEKSWTITIQPQKVTLSDVDMNTLFSDVFYMLDYRIEYAGLGGRGCEFAINIYQV